MSYLKQIVARYEVELDRRERNILYLNDPGLWAQERLGITLWYKQLEVCRSIIDNKNTAVRAGHGVGKSFLAALLACWWIDVHQLGTAFVATTAPSAEQVSGIIFREIKRLHLLAKTRAREMDNPDLVLPGRVTEDNKWKIDLDGSVTTVASGRKPPDNKSEDAFQGLHAEYLLSIGDEACGLSESMVDGLGNITSNKTSRRLLIGNPTDPRSHFAKIFKQLGQNDGEEDGWHLIGISVMDNPNFHGGGLCVCHLGQPLGLGMSDSALRSLSDQSFVDDKLKEYGEENARYISRVLGEFAFEAGNNLFSDYDIAQATNTVVMPDPESPYKILGVDVARLGGDFTYLYIAESGYVQATDDETGVAKGGLKLDDEGEPIPGWKVRHVAHWQAPLVDRMEEDGSVSKGSTGMIHDWAMSLGVHEVRVDASGMGMGVIDPLSVLAHGKYYLVEMMGGGASPDRRAYHNNRAFQFSDIRRRAFQGLIDIDPLDELLIDELGGVQFEFNNTSGGMVIESKESMKKRGVKSPDAADAVTYALADLTHLIGSPFAGLKAGTIVRTDMEQYLPSGLGAFWDYSF